MSMEGHEQFLRYLEDARVREHNVLVVSNLEMRIELMRQVAERFSASLGATENVIEISPACQVYFRLFKPNVRGLGGQKIIIIDAPDFSFLLQRTILNSKDIKAHMFLDGSWTSDPQKIISEIS